MQSINGTPEPQPENNKDSEFSVISEQPEAQEPNCLQGHCRCMYGSAGGCKNHHYSDCKTGPYAQPEPPAQDGAQVEGPMELDYTEFRQRCTEVMGFVKYKNLEVGQANSLIIQHMQPLLATATREAYERCLEAVGEDEPEVAPEGITGETSTWWITKAYHRNQLRAEIRQRLAERGNNGRGEK